VFGYDSDEILRVPLSDLIAKEHWPVAAENLEKRMNGTLERVHYVTRCIRKDGVPVDIQVHGATIEIGGKRTLISLFTDITEQLRAERELQALHAQLRDQAIRDPLTRLFNRRYLEETLSRELIRAGRQNEPFAVIMADIDHFKAVNDQYGHPAGDQVLRVFAEAVRRCRRGSDIHCRYGGEEFVLVCPGIAIQTARRRAEQLRRAIAAIPIAAGPATTLRITASFGISLYPQHGSTVAELIAAADAALYEAKRSGRNCVRMLPERNPPCAAE
jgi:diguanylate cyclase (GGDEF)-like protein/PAS domain S-box-containing protein